MLSDDDVARIQQEERLRSDIREQFRAEAEKKKSTGLRAWEWLNSTFAIWLLSAVCVTGLGSCYSQKQAEHTEAQKKRDQQTADLAKKDEDSRAEIRKKNELIERMDLELGFRFSQLLLRLYDHSDKTAEVRLGHGKSGEDVHALLVALRESSAKGATGLFPEFSNLSTLALISEQRRNLPETERKEFDRVLADLSGIDVLFEVEKVKFIEVNAVAGLVHEKLILNRWRASSFYFLDGSRKAPFP